jgi:hypothetical protein
MFYLCHSLPVRRSEDVSDFKYFAAYEIPAEQSSSSEIPGFFKSIRAQVHVSSLRDFRLREDIVFANIRSLWDQGKRPGAGLDKRNLHKTLKN